MKVLALLLITVLVVSLFAPCDAAKDRKKKKQQQQRHEDSALEERESEGKLEEQKEREQEKQERVHALVERQEERKKEKEDESSEEKSDEEDEDNKSKNGTSAEIVIPRAKRMAYLDAANLASHRTKRQGDLQTMKKSTEINDGAKLPIAKRPTQEESQKTTEKKDGTIEIRRRRSTDIAHEIKKSPEINDGKQIEIVNRPKVDQKN